MVKDRTDNPKIVIDYPRNRIRIHKNTLRVMGTPEYVLLIVNPEQKTLCVICGGANIQGSHKIHINNSRCIELCSKSLNGTLRNAFHVFSGNISYVIEGEYIASENMVKFDITKSLPIK